MINFERNEMKNNINKVAQTIAKEISKFPANTPVDHGTFHHTLGMTKRESEAWSMASWFLSKIEKVSLEDNKEEFNNLRKQLSDLAIAEVGK
jgi:hypothetical protein